MRKRRAIVGNITGRSVTPTGTKLNVGIDTMANFNVVTSAPMQWTENVRMRFTNSQSTLNNYLSSDSHTPQFSQNSGVIFVDGDSYDNKIIAKNAQFIAPQDGYVKSVQGYIVASGSSGCTEDITISVWSKAADASGTATTPMDLIFSQGISFATPSNQFVLAIDSKLYGTYNKLGMNEGEGVIFSIKRDTEGVSCVTCQATITMVFESTDNQAITEEFMLPSLSGSNSRVDTTVCSPDKGYRFLGTEAKKISE